MLDTLQISSVLIYIYGGCKELGEKIRYPMEATKELGQKNSP